MVSICYGRALLVAESVFICLFLLSIGNSNFILPGLSIGGILRMSSIIDKLTC